MKTGLQIFAAVLAATSVWAQTTPTAPPGTISRPASSPSGYPTTAGGLGPANLTFTNQNGATFSIAQLDSQLQNLQSAIQQALPVLAAFNNQFGSQSGTSSSWAGTLQNILSGALGRNSGGASGGTSPGATNFTGVLGRLLSTNANNAGTVSLNPSALAELKSLESDLESISPILQSLNITNSVATTYPSAPYPYTRPPNAAAPAPPVSPGGPLTPTGR